ncbi:MAG: hypothetical protein AAGI88_26400, partial [Pseudomonadota bacterium]
ASGFYTNWTVSYAGEAFSDVENLAVDEADSYTLVNARVGFRGKWFEIYAFGTNLLDEEYISEQNTFAADLETGAVNAVPGPVFNISDPRIIGAGLLFEY